VGARQHGQGSQRQDRQAAEAVRARIDRKYLLALDLDLADPGFDHSLLCEFRGRLLGRDAAERLLARVLDVAREAGLLKARGRQRTDSTHVLAALRELNRIELLAETLRAALNAITVAAPDWLCTVALAEWHERYGRRIEEMRLPEVGPKRDGYVVQVGAEGHGRGQAPLRAAPRDRKHAVASRARLRPAPDALPRPSQDGPAARGHCRGHQPRPHGSLVRRSAYRAHTHVALCWPYRMMGEFATRSTARGARTIMARK